jgi:hypothetical protein
MAITITTPTIGGDESTWGSTINQGLTAIQNTFNGSGTGKATVAPDLSTLTINGTNVTATAAQLNHVQGVTSSIQGQFATKQSTITGAATTIDTENLTVNRALISSGSGKVAVSAITSTELGYLDGVTSSIQTQLNSVGSGTMSSFQLEDGDGTEVTISDAKEVKFVEGGGIDINWTDTAPGSNADPYDMTFALKGDQRLSASNDVYVGNLHEHLHFNDGDNRIEFMVVGGEEMRLWTSPTSPYAGNLDVNGNITAFSTLVSDQRLKHDIQKIDNALDKISQINGYTFTYNKNNKKSAGVVAQEIEKILPSAVDNRELVFHGQEGIEYKTVEYDQLHGLLVEAIKELKEEIEELKNGSAK